jgi:hypothetical protein
MNPNERARQLHDKATRGALLAPAEQAQLQEWYARQDEQERTLLTQPASPTVPALQAQIDAAIAQLGAITQQIQRLAAENEAVRQEVAVLRRQLTDRLMAQSA